MFFYDTETCGFHGLPVLIQYAKDEGPVVIHDIWSKEVGETLDLIEEMMDDGVCGYNLAFDHFHIQKLFNTFSLLPRNRKPESIVHDVYLAEEEGLNGKCLKPYEAVDLMMHVRKSKFQQSMARPVIRIKTVHVTLAQGVCDYLNKNLILDSYLHTSQDPIWTVEKIYDKKGNWIRPDFRDIEGRVKPSGGLKAICAHAFQVPVHKYPEIMPDTKPVELGYIPYAKGIVELDEWPTKSPPPGFNKDYRGTWPLHIQHHKLHWMKRRPRQYAEDDVILTRRLYHYFGNPDPCKDSELACSVASCRWKGFDLDTQKLTELRDKYKAGINQRIIAPARSHKYLIQAMDKFEYHEYMDENGKMAGGTSAPVLEILSKWVDLCEDCLIDELDQPRDGCAKCQKHEVARRAEEIIRSRKSAAKVVSLNKLIMSKKLHPGYNVIGTKSSRMSGTGGFNPQGVDRSDEFRECFTLAPEGATLMGGDFDGFELTICDAVYNDSNWHNTLIAGKKVHAVFGSGLYDMTYDQVINDKARYTKAKSGLFLLIYGGEANGIEYKLEATAEQAKRAESNFFKNFPDILKRRLEIYKDYRPLQDDFSWVEPKSYIESFMGHKRYFDLEWNICRVLFKLAKNVDNDQGGDQELCERVQGRKQTPVNALRSALYGAIKKIQTKASRAAINHEIQSPGADITKIVQKAIWDLQPTGVSDWKVQTMNIHDEIICVVHDPTLVNKVEAAVYSKIDELRERVPLLKMNWGAGSCWKDIH